MTDRLKTDILVFTLCSNNYFAQAKTMLDSFKKYHTEISTYLFLCDRLSSTIRYDELESTELVVINEKVVREFDQLVNKYTLFELNSILKPFLFQWLIKKNNPEKIFYIDSDVLFFDNLDVAVKALDEYDIVITPHFWTPIPDDGLEPFENNALNFGTYNLGFIGVQPQKENTRRFLQWWGERTRKFGHNDTVNGYFVDQIWFNLVPLFFENVLSLKHPGYNMAAWNLHERKINGPGEKGEVFLESGDPLVFYHYSSYDPQKPGELSQKYNRYQLEDQPGLKKLYQHYHQDLVRNGLNEYSKITCALPVRREHHPGFVRKMLHPGVALLKKIWRKL